MTAKCAKTAEKAACFSGFSDHSAISAFLAVSFSGVPEGNPSDFLISRFPAFRLFPKLVMPKILLVEDNEMNRDMLSRRLIRRGFEVVMAVDGGEGVTLATTISPDLVLMDMSLPVLDGWEATRRIRAHERGRSVPIIALTAHAMSGDREKTLAAGCNDYDTKPVQLDRLLAKIAALLPGMPGAPGAPGVPGAPTEPGSPPPDGEKPAP